MTAVEWLVQQICGKHTEVWKEEIQQAKAMEKEQIVEAFKHGEFPPIFVNFNAEEYYNETFKKDNTYTLL